MGKMWKNKSKLQNKSPKGEKVELKFGGMITKKMVTKKVSKIKELATENNDVVDVKETMQLRSGKSLVTKDDRKPPQLKKKPVEKQKKRQKTQIDDTKMLPKLKKK